MSGFFVGRRCLKRQALFTGRQVAESSKQTNMPARPSYEGLAEPIKDFDDNRI
jgi:hypothetical protein